MAGLVPAIPILWNAVLFIIEITGTNPRIKSGEVTTWEGDGRPDL